jgi:hypothetical protein
MSMIRVWNTGPTPTRAVLPGGAAACERASPRHTPHPAPSNNDSQGQGKYQQPAVSPVAVRCALPVACGVVVVGGAGAGWCVVVGDLLLVLLV